MSDSDLDRAFDRTSAPDPALVQRISGSIVPRLERIRPLPAPWILGLWMAAAAVAAGIAGAALLGLYGIQALSAGQAVLIFTLLAALLSVGAMANTARMIPGRRPLFSAWTLVVLASAALAADFAVAFRDYSTEDFVSQGFTCLKAGLLDAIPAAMLVWLVLRRGFAVDPKQAGATAGALAGLAGAFMLELHCPLLEVPHAAVWHVAVIPVSALAGWIVAAIASRMRRANGGRRGEN